MDHSQLERGIALLFADGRQHSDTLKLNLERDLPRVAIELLLNTAARRGDVHLLGRQHLRDGSLTWRPSKTSGSTGKLLTIPVLPELQRALDAMPPGDALTFILSEHGRPFASGASFGNAFADWCMAAGLKPVKCGDGKIRNYRAHGLRKAACTQLAEAGCSAMEIMAVSGHVTLSEAQKYVAAAEQKKMAAAAMAQRGGGSKPVQISAPTDTIEPVGAVKNA
jgi:integrase